MVPLPLLVVLVIFLFSLAAATDLATVATPSSVLRRATSPACACGPATTGDGSASPSSPDRSALDISLGGPLPPPPCPLVPPRAGFVLPAVTAVDFGFVVSSDLSLLPVWSLQLSAAAFLASNVARTSAAVEGGALSPGLFRKNTMGERPHAGEEEGRAIPGCCSCVRHLAINDNAPLSRCG